MTKLFGTHQPNRILDVGAGSGFFSKYLLENSPASEAWCVDISYDYEQTDIVNGKPIHFVKSIDEVDADLVLLMDILEHVDDDQGLLSEYVSKVPTGSRFLITVPAFNFLWSGHDDFLDHRRRYTLPHLERVVTASGLKVELGSYYYGMVFPIAASIRLTQNLISKDKSPKSQMSKHSGLVNQILMTMCSAELPFLKYNRVAGLSVCCYAQK